MTYKTLTLSLDQAEGETGEKSKRADGMVGKEGWRSYM